MNDDTINGGAAAADSEAFCATTDAAVSMFMGGFRFVTLDSNLPCLNLYFLNWTLDSLTKFLGACLGLAVMAVAAESLIVARHKLLNVYSSPRCRMPVPFVRVIMATLHLVQALLGYILHLAAMTFAAEFLLSIIVGLAVGYGALFSTDEIVEARAEKAKAEKPTTSKMFSRAGSTDVEDEESPEQSKAGQSVHLDSRSSVVSQIDDHAEIVASPL